MSVCSRLSKQLLLETAYFSLMVGSAMRDESMAGLLSERIDLGHSMITCVTVRMSFLKEFNRKKYLNHSFLSFYH